MRHLLLISAYFPPDGGPGTQRAAKFCRYLPDAGWCVTVLTRTPPAERGRWDPQDDTLLDDVARCRAIERVGVPEEHGGWRRRWQLDAFEPWVEPALARAEAIIRRERVDAVVLSMSPFSLAAIGARLREQFDVPVVFDLRDPWAFDGWRVLPTRWHQRRDHAQMVAALRTADLVIANTPEAAAALRGADPGVADDRVTVITNGYDEHDFHAPAPTQRDDCFVVAHTGSFHSESLYADGGLRCRLKRRLACRSEPIDPTGRTPHYLLRALRELRRSNHPLGARMRLVCAGVADRATERCVAESGVSDAVSLLGYRSHGEAVRLLQSADALFLPMHDLPAGRRALIVPGKTYEYLGARRPILACVPPGDARDWIEASGAGYCAEPTCVASIRRALERLADVPPPPAASDFLAPFTRRATARILADRLDALLDARRTLPLPKPVDMPTHRCAA